MKRYALLTASNTFPLLGADATLRGCLNDSDDMVAKILHDASLASLGWTLGYSLKESNDNADNVRAKLDEIVAKAVSGDQIVVSNSSHGTHFTDRITGQTVSCTVCHDSTWDRPESFVSKLDYQRAFAKLKAGVRVWCFFDSCESGNIGQSFKMLETFTARNRWIEAPSDIAKELDGVTEVKLPKQVATMAGCVEKGTCADVGGTHPHGLFSATRNDVWATQKMLSWSKFGAAISGRMQGQVTVCNGPDDPFLSVA